MFDVVNTSESLLVVSLLAPASLLTSVDVDAVSYSPAFLLPVQFDTRLTLDPEYQKACQVGFDDGFERLSEEDERELFIWDMVRNEVLTSLLDVQRVLPLVFPPAHWPGLLAFCSAGFPLWL